MKPNERKTLSLKDPTGWPEAVVEETPDDFTPVDQTRENLEARRAARAAELNAAADRLAPKHHRPQPLTLNESSL
jgi:hypothetical protein